ncbi:MAG TPA: glutamine--fructose-6-phosphate transaminase (isomerizing) [Elusimicrobia bacterium]|nr:glutamine--fructose-6-phosphate transaminase (isomerizing) [Elusimicrobiota bacterium]HBT60994.1 glutamine--fructose-6-phosphate transaminase (isomerizing) [Elusimicrobiota bacterium]
MCGIVGYAGRQQATPLILEGLKRLEYRGYDSAGIAMAEGGGIQRSRAAGKLANLEAILKKAPLKGVVALGHTRWATHGKPSEENAHPHCDCSGQIVVIHNGIIENYVALKEKLAACGHEFASETDTEVVAHLIEEKIKGQGARAASEFSEPVIFEATRQALNEIKGAYALAVLWARAPGVIIAAKTASPLIIGLGQGENFLASDVPAFLAHTRKAVFLEDGEMAVVKAEGCRYFSLAGKRIEKTPVTIQWDRTMAEKGGFRHFMLKEIYEQPAACEDTMRGRFFPLRDDGVLRRDAGLDSATLKAARQFHIVACGTAYHAGLIAKYWLEEMAQIPVHAETASEFRYRESTLRKDDLVITISQSGETADTLAAVRRAKERGAKVLSVCNTLGAAIPRASDFNLYTHCGPELGVASTKAFVGQLSALAVFTLHCALARGAMSEPDARKFVDELVKLPGDIREVLKLDDRILEIARKVHKKEHFLFIGRHVNFPIALEGALKLKEISYTHAEGYAAGEMKHGPIALIDESVTVLAIATRSRTYDKMASNCQEAKARGAQVIALVTAGDPPMPGADFQIQLPEVSELLSPLVNIIPLQLLAYHVADLRGCDVDQPRNLAKSVTVE